jgi:hypothetical protein
LWKSIFVSVWVELNQSSAPWERTARTQSGYAKFYSRSHDAVIRVHDEAGNVIETHEHKGDFKEGKNDRARIVLIAEWQMMRP